MTFSRVLRSTRTALRFTALIGSLILGAAPSARAAPVEPVSARLVPEAAGIAPGTTQGVDLHLHIAPGWHTYWRNPGDSGLPTEIAWKLPVGFGAGDILWPVPERFVLGAIGNYGYAGSTDLLVPIAAPAALEPGGTSHLEAEAHWLVCSEICIPGEAALQLDLPAATAAPSADPSAAAIFAAARARLPQPAGFTTRFAAAGGEVRLFVPQSALAGRDVAKAAFFPYDGNLVDAAIEPRTERRPDGID